MKWTLWGVGFVALAAFGLLNPDSSADSAPQPASQDVRARNDLLARTRILRPEPFNAARLDFAADPNAGLIDPQLTTCTFKPTELSGTTAKFDCELPTGEKIKVKYGWTLERHSEIAATRLLHGLGFGADRMSRVERLRCLGCPIAPFHTRLVAYNLHLGRQFDERLHFDRARDFEEVAVERKLDGEAVEPGGLKGWGFYELSQLDASRGGASRAEVDALRLMAVFLAHWDNKAPNQRLLCPGSETADCEHPLAMIQDAGSDFGPRKVNLVGWRRTPIWADRASCLVSMKDLPYDGATFQDARISEEGRRLLGDRLKQIPASQVHALFAAAGFEEVPAWTEVFEAKVREISDRPSCPSQGT